MGRRGRRPAQKANAEAGGRPNRGQGKKGRGRMKKMLSKLDEQQQVVFKAAASEAKAGNHQGAAQKFNKLATELAGNEKFGGAARIQLLAARAAGAAGNTGARDKAIDQALAYGSKAPNKQRIARSFAQLVGKVRAKNPKAAKELVAKIKTQLGVSSMKPARRGKAAQ